MHIVPRRLSRLLRRRRQARRAAESQNILAQAAILAARDSAQYYLDHMTLAKGFATKWAMIEFAIRQIDRPGLVLEFGVAKGSTINFMAERTERTIYGFDSFEGLPEPWITGRDEGRYRVGGLPKVAPNVQLRVGTFDATLPAFVRERDEPVAFLHIDSDLYSSAKTVFDHLGDRIGSGALILFDEYFNYPGWRLHEYKAFQEFVARRGLAYDYLAFVPDSEQVLCRIR
jgi:hypothetical protein